MRILTKKFCGRAAAFSLATAAIFASSAASAQIPPELLGKAPPGGKSRASPVYEDANGKWALFGAGSPDGKNCAVAYTAPGKTLILIGPDSRDLAGFIFLSPDIPTTDTQREAIVELHSDADPNGKPTKGVPVMVLKSGPDHGADGMIATSIGNMSGFLEGLREAQSIWVTEAGNTLFRVDNIGGIYQARDALADCMKLPQIKTKS